MPEYILVRRPEGDVERQDDLGQGAHSETGDCLPLAFGQRRIEFDRVSLEHAKRQCHDDRIGLKLGIVS